MIFDLLIVFSCSFGTGRFDHFSNYLMICLHVIYITHIEKKKKKKKKKNTGPRSAVGNVPGYRCVPDCNSRGREFNPGPVPYFRGA